MAFLALGSARYSHPPWHYTKAAAVLGNKTRTEKIHPKPLCWLGYKIQMNVTKDAFRFRGLGVELLDGGQPTVGGYGVEE